jgi:predicted glycogen debranching enzyme
MVLANGFDAWVETSGGAFAISSQRYGPDVIHPDGASRIESFDYEPWPRWRYRIDNDLVIEQELFVPKGESAIFVSWRVATGDSGATLKVRPLLSGRDFHSTHHENGSFKFVAERDGERVTFRSYDGVPAVVAYSNGHYTLEPTWYRNFLYSEEQARGLDAAEDLASPGVFESDAQTIRLFDLHTARSNSRSAPGASNSATPSCTVTIWFTRCGQSHVDLTALTILPIALGAPA